MSQKPLDYQNLQIVLTYLDANKRFQLSSRCPSIKNIEHLVPLRIDKLKFDTKDLKPRITINSIDYVIGTIRIYPEDTRIPIVHQEENEQGGVATDLDRFGAEDYSADSASTPGDVVISDPRMSVQMERAQVLRKEELISALKGILALHGKRKRSNRTVYVGNEEDRDVVEAARSWTRERLEKYIDRVETPLLPIYSRRRNEEARFGTIAQLSVGNTVPIIRQYQGKIHQVEKKLTSFFFEARTNIFVRQLQIDRPYMILRLPPNLNLRIKELKAMNEIHIVVKAINSFVDKASYPLSYLETDDLEPDIRILNTAKKLRVTRLDLDSFQQILEIRNQIVDVKEVDVEPDDFLMLARRWLATPKPVGTRYRFGMRQADTIIGTMDLLEGIEGSQRGERFITIRLNAISELKISYKHYEGQAIPWIFKWKILEIIE